MLDFSVWPQRCVSPGQGVTCGCLRVVCAFECVSRGCLNPGSMEWVVDLPGKAVGGRRRYTIQSIWFLQRKADQDDLSSAEAAKVKRQFVLGCWQPLWKDERVKWHKTQSSGP